MRRVFLLGFFLASPLLARANALEAAFLVFQLVAVVAGIALLGVFFTLWACFRPASHTLQVTNGVFVSMSLLLGLM